MKATEIRDNIFKLESDLHKLSEFLVNDIEYDGLDIIYLKNKFESLLNTAKHIQGQFKNLPKRK